jgi:hypothetical protein
VYEPTKESIAQVIAQVEADRDDWEKYLAEQKAYKQFKSKFMHMQMNDEMLLMYYDMGFLDSEPKWKYKTVEPPKSLLIMDDILNSAAISASSGLIKIATLNRHIAELQQDYKGRSACGLAVIILSQSYRMQNGQGIGRSLRENLSLFTMFKNKQPKQYEAIKEEIGSVVDMDRFDKAYQYATAEKYGNLTVDFKPKQEELTFRKNLNEAIIF